MRVRTLLDHDWRFALGHASNPALDFNFARSRSLIKAGEERGAGSPTFDDTRWRVVQLPHDWAVELPFDSKGNTELCDHGFRSVGPDHPESSVGWYRKRFVTPSRDRGRRTTVEFDGVFRDSTVWINGHLLGRHASGYTGFRYDLTDYLFYGTEKPKDGKTPGENVLAVRVDASMYEGWWYEGAGIYRHVWLTKTSPLNVVPDGVIVTTHHSRSAARVSVTTSVRNEADQPGRFDLLTEAVDPSGKVVAAAVQRGVSVAPWSNTSLPQSLSVRKPRLWSCETPHLYTLRTTVMRGRAVIDRVQTTFGIRSLRWDSKRGFFLNGKRIVIKGTCNHQNFAGVGTAMPDALHEYRLRKLKEMGSNAYRCSHYAVAPELLDACDRLGLLVMAENRLAGSAHESLGQFEAMIRRDRNHPSVILWSIGNEEHTIQWSVAGERIGRTMVRRAHELDPTRMVTAAMHDRGLDEGFANIVDVHGWNYMNVGSIEAFHKRRPAQPIVGSEEGSTLTTRGIYSDDPSLGYVRAYDERKPKWGSTAEGWWSYFAARPWLAGGFVWTGFDYRGEPIPYKWPCTAAHFGLMDLCGFPKDIYYYYKSWWADAPVLHLFPHWNWPGREGQAIEVRCFTNCDSVELVLNGRSCGRERVPRNSHAGWQVVYEPGQLEARGFRGRELATRAVVETTGPARRLELAVDRERIRCDGRDVSCVTVSAHDARGRLVPLADDRVDFNIAGPGRLIGVGNGNPSSHESDKACFRKLFNGLALALVQSTGERTGTIEVTAKATGLRVARTAIATKK